MITIGFKWTGGARKLVQGDSRKEWLVWIIGMMLFAHVVGFFGIEYFDQTRFSWYATLAIIPAATLPIFRGNALQDVPKMNELAVPAFWPPVSSSPSRRLSLTGKVPEAEAGCLQTGAFRGPASRHTSRGDDRTYALCSGCDSAREPSDQKKYLKYDSKTQTDRIG
jgi:hypothetical protein